MEKKYSIGEIADRLGLTPQALRYFEQRGFIDIDREIENNWRSFSRADLYSILRFNFFRSCGFPLREARDKFIDSTLEETREGMIRRAEEIRQEVRWQQRIMETLEHKAAVLDRAIHRLGECEEGSLSRVWCVFYPEDDGPLQPPALRELVKRWAAAQPVVRPFTVWSVAGRRGGIPAALRERPGLGCFLDGEGELAPRVFPGEEPFLEDYSSPRCIYGVFRATSPQERLEDFRRMEEYAGAAKLDSRGMMLSRPIASKRYDGVKVSYYEAWLLCSGRGAGGSGG